MSTGNTVEKDIKQVHVGNLDSSVTNEDLRQLFGLNATAYLKESCKVEISTNATSGEKFATVMVPGIVHGELLKLNGIEFHGQELIIEEGKKSDAVTEPSNRGGKQRGRGRGRGWGRGRGGGRGGFNRADPRGTVTLEPDQVFHMIDCGVNLANRKFNQGLDYVIGRALSAGVQKMVVTGLRLDGCKNSIVMAKTRPNILFAAIGIHPHYVKDDWNDKTLEQLEEMVKQPECVAIGECGLDFNRDYSPQELQKSTFKQQVQLAVTYNKALLVHERDSHDGILEVLKEFEGSLPPVIVHCFTGSTAEIKTYVEKGFYVGITGYVCKEKHGADIRAAITDGTLPLENIILESNAPYMVPNPGKDQIDPVSQTLLDHCYVDNEPCTLSIIVRCIAKCLSQEPSEIANKLTENALKVYKLKKAD